jgi:aspartyl/glutamyl-tRNA(Asn/Gln) amidotransferase C subunit
VLTRDDVKKIAALARIGLEDKEIEKYQKDLSGILDYFKELEELDTKDVEPIGHITGKYSVFRPDKRGESTQVEREAILKNSPERKGNYLKVKSVL